jgi:hypothetical protein
MSKGAVLLGMATLVSVVAATGLVGIGTVFAPPWSEVASSTRFGNPQAEMLEEEGPVRAYVFSFGLEHATYGSSEDPTRAKGDNSRVTR